MNPLSPAAFRKLLNEAIAYNDALFLEADDSYLQMMREELDRVLAKADKRGAGDRIRQALAVRNADCN